MRHGLQHSQSGFAAGFAQPERGLLAQLFRTARSGKTLERAVRRRVRMQRNRRQRSMHPPLHFAAFGVCPRHIPGEQSDALRRTHARQPDKGQAAGIELAILANHANAFHGGILHAEQYRNPAAPFELDAPAIVRIHADSLVVAPLQPAAPAAKRCIIVHEVSATDGPVSGNFRYGVPNPRGGLRTANQHAELVLERSFSLA